MRDKWLHPEFVRRQETPVAGDTPLMLAIRTGDRNTAKALLQLPETDLSNRNSRGETALYLALQRAELDLVTELYQAGAPDAQDLLSDERFTADEYVLLNRIGTATPQAEVERLFSAAPPRANMHPVTFEGLSRLRSGGATIVEQHYPRSDWMQPLSQTEAARKTLALSSLRTKGLAKLGTVLSPRDIVRIREYLAAQPIYAGHVANVTDGTPRSLQEIEKDGGQGCYSAESALAAPRLLDIANDPIILNVVAEYFGFTPTIYSVNIHWSFPHDRPDGQMFSTESMHRDYNDYCDVALFIYLTDVDAAAGPHRYYMRTHTLDTAVERLERRLPMDTASLVARDLFRSVWDGHGRMGMVEDLFADDVADITGPAGTAFLTDTFGFHRALPPREAPRLLAWFRYGAAVQLNRSPFVRSVDPITEHYDPFINRLLPGMRDTAVLPRSPEVSSATVRLLVDGYAGTQYNLCEYDGSIYAVHQAEGVFDINRIRMGDTARPVFTGASRDEVIAQLSSYLKLADAPKQSATITA